MKDPRQLIIPLHQSSRYPDLDANRLLTAVDLAFANSGKSSFDEVAALAIRFLPSPSSEFERGVVSGLVFAQCLADGERRSVVRTGKRP